MGNVVRTGLDADSDGALTISSDYRIQETEHDYDPEDCRWERTRQTVFTSGIGDGGPITTWVLRRMPGLSGDPDQTITVDANGNRTETTVAVNRATHQVTRTTLHPDESIEVTITTDGLLTSSTSRSGLTTEYHYDALRRRTEEVNPRTGPTKMHYYTDSSAPGALKGRLRAVEDPEHRTTTYEYYQSGAQAGQLRAIVDPASKRQYFSYTDRGELHQTWGETTYPVQNEYDAYGRRISMSTYRTGTSWHEANWPGSPAADVTTWVYTRDGVTLKWPFAKRYADDTETRYTYRPDGKLATRTWARTVDGQPLVTRYDYHAAMGDLLSIDYSDSTPDVAFTYDRLGRQETIHDAVGTRTFAYNEGDMQLATETIVAGLNGLYSKTITRKYEEQDEEDETRIPGRPAGFTVGSTSEYDVTYYYDDYGRIKRITGPGLPTYGAVYSRMADSELVKYLRFQSSETTTLATVERSYEAQRDLITSVENSTTSLISGYTYRNDDLGRRKDVVHTGSAFNQAHLFKWDYNTRNELRSADRHVGTLPDAPGSLMTPGDYDYTYDNIGNRTDSSVDADTTTYTPNELNQYESTGNPAEHFCYDEDGNLTQDHKISASCEVNDGQRRYTWDAENRLVEVAPAILADGSVKLRFAYDYIGRRVGKTVHTYSQEVWNLVDEFYFVYDAWNVVEVLRGPNRDLEHKYTWGLDLSGWSGNGTLAGVYGAGGIGGLLALDEVTGSYAGSYWYVCDGNGNIGQIIRAFDRTTVAAYEYDPYGNTLAASGFFHFIRNSGFRHSTKWMDFELFGNWDTLYYYGYRYYRPRLGKWLSRDPASEQGGFNLFAYTLNNPVGFVDPLGEMPQALMMWIAANCAKGAAASIVWDLGLGLWTGSMPSGCVCFCNASLSCVVGGLSGPLSSIVAEIGPEGIVWLTRLIDVLNNIGIGKFCRETCASPKRTPSTPPPLCPLNKKPCYVGCIAPDCVDFDQPCGDMKSPWECLGLPTGPY